MRAWSPSRGGRRRASARIAAAAGACGRCRRVGGGARRPADARRPSKSLCTNILAQAGWLGVVAVPQRFAWSRRTGQRVAVAPRRSNSADATDVTASGATATSSNCSVQQLVAPGDMRHARSARRHPAKCDQPPARVRRCRRPTPAPRRPSSSRNSRNVPPAEVGDRVRPAPARHRQFAPVQKAGAVGPQHGARSAAAEQAAPHGCVDAHECQGASACVGGRVGRRLERACACARRRWRRHGDAGVDARRGRDRRRARAPRHRREQAARWKTLAADAPRPGGHAT
ncbi:hypothetical protein RLIN73S_07214 [Rhodanobacter lindaniclasticus]